MAETSELTISHLGAQGDGVAESDGRAIYVPFTLAGETVRAEIDGANGRLIEVLSASADRVAPVCRHFGTCGGCALQHMRVEAYRAWKERMVAAAFAARGLEIEVAPLVMPAGKRRRAVLTAARTGKGIVLGFHVAQSHELVDLAECPVLADAIVASLPALRRLLATLLVPGAGARVTATEATAGLDIHLDELSAPLSPRQRSQIAAEATAAGFARIAVKGETVFEAAPPSIVCGGAEVPLPPRVFIQAMAETEATMVGLVTASVGKARSVVDLFSGLGALSFPLARRARVAAFDSDGEAISALLAAARKARGLKPISARVRDLFREPLSATELNEHEAIVFDPPRAGAEAQSRRIAGCKVKTVVAVSCNPATLARDARILVDGGYRLGLVTPFDQFRYSPHIEVVAAFSR